MSLDKDTIHIQLLGNTYAMACSADETGRLKEAAQYLAQKIHTLAMAHKGLPAERLAIMVALQLAHELLTQRVDSLDYKEHFETKVRALVATLDMELVERVD